MTSLHGADAFDADVARAMIALVAERIDTGAPLGRTAMADDITAVLDGSITEHGLGGEAAWQRFLDGVAANTVGLDSDRFLAFIPVSPSAASIWMDTVVGGTSFSAESWLEAGAAFVAPTTWRGRAVGRLVFMHPSTPPALIEEIADSLR
jgi:hypothetical protein